MTSDDIGDSLAFVNAMLNATSSVLLVLGRRAIKAGRRQRHRTLMIAAVTTSAVFLVSYLTRVAISGTHADPHRGAVHAVYLAILGTHMILATSVPVFAVVLLWLAGKERFATHRRVARWGLPIWLYVSVTGVLVYAILYHLPA